jgi:ankyrin repeat protein
LDDAVDALDSGDTSLLLVRTATNTKGKKKGGGGVGGGGELPIHHAARTKATDALCKILMRKHGLQEQQLLAQGTKGMLPLHYAVKTRHVDTVSILCGRGDRGGEISLEGGLMVRQLSTADTAGRLPIHYAMEASDTATMLELVASGSEDQLITPDPSTGTSAIHHAAKAGASDLVDAMVSPLVDSARRTVLLHKCNEDGRLPVHYAVLAGDRKSTRSLGYVERNPPIPSSDAPGTAESTQKRIDDSVAENVRQGAETVDGVMSVIPMATADRHGKIPIDYAFDLVEEAKAHAELVIARADAEWSAELDSVVSSHTEAQAALAEECAQKDAELAEKQGIIEALQAEVVSMKRQLEELTVAAGAAAAAGAAVEEIAEEGVPPV